MKCLLVFLAPLVVFPFEQGVALESVSGGGDSQVSSMNLHMRLDNLDAALAVVEDFYQTELNRAKACGDAGKLYVGGTVNGGCKDVPAAVCMASGGRSGGGEVAFGSNGERGERGESGDAPSGGGRERDSYGRDNGPSGTDRDVGGRVGGGTAESRGSGHSSMGGW